MLDWEEMSICFNEPVEYGVGTRYLQWKGTNVCMDGICICGQQGHLHGDFVYFLRCPACGRVYLNPSVAALIELTGQERAEALQSPSLHFITNEPEDP